MMVHVLPKQLERLATCQLQPECISIWVISQLESGHQAASNVTLTLVNPVKTNSWWSYWKKFFTNTRSHILRALLPEVFNEGPKTVLLVLDMQLHLCKHVTITLILLINRQHSRFITLLCNESSSQLNAVNKFFKFKLLLLESGSFKCCWVMDTCMNQDPFPQI